MSANDPVADIARNDKLRVMHLGRLLALLAIALATSGCSNRVFSEQPWFDNAMATGGPVFRDGIWLVDDPRCKVRETQLAENWPDCARWTYRRGNQSLTPQWLESCERKPCRRAYDEWSVSEDLTVSGDPMISQTDGCVLGLPEEAVADDAPAANMIVDTNRKAKYCYDGVLALARDGQGRITSVEAWPVLCGPWPGISSRSNVTSHPWSGVTIVGENCTVANETTLRGVAARSYDVAKAAGLVVRGHWIRDGYH